MDKEKRAQKQRDKELHYFRQTQQNKKEGFDVDARYMGEYNVEDRSWMLDDPRYKTKRFYDTNGRHVLTQVTGGDKTYWLDRNGYTALPPTFRPFTGSYEINGQEVVPEEQMQVMRVNELEGLENSRKDLFGSVPPTFTNPYSGVTSWNYAGLSANPSMNMAGINENMNNILASRLMRY